MHKHQRILGDLVKAERLKRGMTQEQLAIAIHSNKRTIIDIEKYRGNPKLDTLIELLTYLNIDPYIIFFQNSPGHSEALSHLEQQLHDCSEEQIDLLVPICRMIIEFAEASNHISAK